MPTPDDDDSLSSSLPKSLRQHLYTGPRQQDLDSAPHPPLPLPPLSAPGIPLAPAAAADRLPSSSSSSLLGLAGAAVHQTAIQTHPQRPIYSDPVFHASRSSSLSRIINHSAPHLASEEQYVRRHSWREGEAGPSTFGYPSGTQRNTGAWQIQPKDEALPTVIPREEFSYPSSWPEADPPPTSHSYYHAPSQRRDRIDWGSRDPPMLSNPDIPLFEQRLTSPPPDTHRRSSEHHTRAEAPTLYTMDPSTPPHHMSSTGLYSPQYYSSAPNETSIHEHLRYLPSSSSSMLDNYTLPPPPSDSPSPSTSALRSRLLSPIMLPSSLSDAQNPNANEASSQNHAQKRTKTPVACEFCRGRKLKCDGDKPRCKNCAERQFECRYPTFQRRRGPGKAPRGSRTRKRTRAGSAGASRSASVGRELEASTSGRHMYPAQAHELEALAPEVRQFTSVINLDDYTFEPPAGAPQYPSMQIPRPPETTETGRWASRRRETSSEDRSDAEEMYRNVR